MEMEWKCPSAGFQRDDGACLPPNIAATSASLHVAVQQADRGALRGRSPAARRSGGAPAFSASVLESRGFLLLWPLSGDPAPRSANMFVRVRPQAPQRSRDAFSRLRAWSHWPAMWSSHRRTSSSRAGSISQMWSLPTRAPRTRPAPASTCRCLVTAWRGTSAPAVSRAMDMGPPAQSWVTSPRRVSSPSAAKTGAEPPRPPARLRPAGAFAPAVFSTCLGRPAGLRRRGDIAFDRLHLKPPAFSVHPVRVRAARDGDPIEAGLHDGEHRAAGDLFELEDHPRGGFGRIVDTRLHRGRVPAPGEQPLGLHPLDGDVPRHVLVALVGDGPAHAGAWREGAFHFDGEPRAELRGVAEGAPHAGARDAQQNLPLDAIRAGRAHMQPPGCTLQRARPGGNQKVARPVGLEIYLTLPSDRVTGPLSPGDRGGLCRAPR